MCVAEYAIPSSYRVTIYYVGIVKVRWVWMNVVSRKAAGSFTTAIVEWIFDFSTACKRANDQQKNNSAFHETLI